GAAAGLSSTRVRRPSVK
ncbi:hypothetical protein STIAU_6375, partial [Stigmatella aurantiaca DW4/3-1]